MLSVCKMMTRHVEGMYKCSCDFTVLYLIMGLHVISVNHLSNNGLNSHILISFHVR